MAREFHPVFYQVLAESGMSQDQKDAYIQNCRQRIAQFEQEVRDTLGLSADAPDIEVQAVMVAMSAENHLDFEAIDFEVQLVLQQSLEDAWDEAMLEFRRSHPSKKETPE